MIDTLVCEEPGRLRYHKATAPVSREGQTILRITHTGVCGTDLHAYEGTQPFFSYPRILGHELAAIIEEPGKDSSFSKGDIVTTIPYYHCGNCIACRSGKPNCCTTLKVAGVHIDGGMQSLYAVPSYSLIGGEGLSGELLALTEPLAIGAHGIRRAQVQPGEIVLIFGAGPIGIAAMLFAKQAGAKVIVADVHAGRLKFSLEKTGVDVALNVRDEDFEAQLSALTAGEMAPVVIDATGNVNAINNAFRYIAHGGRYILIGLQKQPVSFSHPEFHKREATLMSSRNATRLDFEQVITSIRNRSIDPFPMITHRVKFNELASVFPGWLNPAADVIKAMVIFDH